LHLDSIEVFEFEASNFGSVTLSDLLEESKDLNENKNRIRKGKKRQFIVNLLITLLMSDSNISINF
jgi:hypothetical protein